MRIYTAIAFCIICMLCTVACKKDFGDEFFNEMYYSIKNDKTGDTAIYINSKMKLKKIPKEIGTLKKTQWFAQEGDFKEIPKELGEMESLQRIDIINNRLKEIPNTIGNLKMLTHLILVTEELISVPETLKECVNLKELIIYSEKLQKIPDIFSNMIHLEELHIYAPRVRRLPESITKLKTLRRLTLDIKNLEYLDPQIFNNPLKQYIVSSDFLQELPTTIWPKVGSKVDLVILLVPNIAEYPDFVHKSTIASLYLYSEKAINFPNNMLNLLTVENLGIEMKSLEKIPDSISALHSLKTLSIFKVDQKRISSSIFHLRGLSGLYLSHNGYQEIPYNILFLEKLEKLSIISNNLKYLPGYIYKLPNLHNIDFSYNKITSISSLKNYKLPLSYICLSNNPITDIPIDFFALENITQIELINCLIEVFPKIHFMGNKLQEINLSNNHITEFPLDILSKSGLSVDLRNNKISKIHYELPSDNNKKDSLRIFYDGNPLDDKSFELIKNDKRFLKSKRSGREDFVRYYNDDALVWYWIHNIIGISGERKFHEINKGRLI